MPPYRRPVNTVFQHYALFPHMDVARNVGYGLRQRRPAPDRTEQQRRIEEALGLVRLTGFGHRRSWELSGGQQQRVALARALINRPTVLLLDEPLGALDLKLRREMQVELKQLQEQLGITFIFVTHDQDEALSMADRVAVMRDGLILQDGPPAHIYDRPVDPWVASFIGHMNFLPGRVEEVGDCRRRATRARPGPSGASCRTSPSASARQALLAVRPERIWLTRGEPQRLGARASRGPRFPGRIVRTVFMGDKVEHIVDAPAVGTLVISAPNVETRRGPGPCHRERRSWSAGRMTPHASSGSDGRSPDGGRRTEEVDRMRPEHDTMRSLLRARMDRRRFLAASGATLGALAMGGSPRDARAVPGCGPG